MLKLFNSLTRRKEAFRPMGGRKVGLYTCGPSVYTHPHIGNYRTYLFEDILKRYLLYKGYHVRHVMNITDVEDKMVSAAKGSMKALGETARLYTGIFLDETKSLGMLPADSYPRATRHISEMVKLINSLVRRGHAYRTEDGNVYYRLSNFKAYGRLSRTAVTREMLGRRVAMDDYYQRQAGDFVLWKAWRKRDGSIYWDTGLGRGRPGWSIECSAISMKYLGERFDIHTGGIDNMFCHHENEIAQSEGATGRKFVNYWLHSRHLIVDGRKMSKSLGNYYTLANLVKQGSDPMAIRYALISAHYRRRLDFSLENVRKAAHDIREHDRLMARIQRSASGTHNAKIRALARKALTDFGKAMDDDLDTEVAMRAYFDFIREAHGVAAKSGMGKDNLSEIMLAATRINSVLGFLSPRMHPAKVGRPA